MEKQINEESLYTHYYLGKQYALKPGDIVEIVSNDDSPFRQKLMSVNLWPLKTDKSIDDYIGMRFTVTEQYQFSRYKLTPNDPHGEEIPDELIVPRYRLIKIDEKVSIVVRALSDGNLSFEIEDKPTLADALLEALLSIGWSVTIREE